MRGAMWSLAAVGAVVMLSAADDGKFALGRNLEILVNMFRDINLFYVDEVNPDELMSDMARGMVLHLDPYTEYISDKDMEGFEILTTGKYAGVGSLIRQNGDYVIFAEPYENSPADKAGIRVGDKIVAIDGEDTKGFTTEQVSNRLKGEPGTTVKLTVERFFSGEREVLKLQREIITVPGVPYYGMLSDSIGIIRHVDFTEECSKEMQKALMALKEQGARGIIVDYRGNGGGVLQEAVKIVSMFVPKGREVVSTKAKIKEMNTSFVTENEPIDVEIPLVMLVNGSSPSATEIVSGALQDMDRAVLMGRRTYGKGLVQNTRPLGYDAYLKLTTAKYYLPSGRCIQAVDYANRNEEGAIVTVPDSLIKEYKTLNGRKIYDGGGVMPDVLLEEDYVSRFAYLVYSYNYVDEFVDEYLRRHASADSEVVPGEYRFPEEHYGEFVAFMTDKEIEWQSETSRLLKQMKTRAEQELYYEAIADELAAIENKITDDKEADLQRHKEDLVRMIEEEIVLRYNYARGVVEHSYATDPHVAAAVELLKNRTEYERILAEQDTSRK